MPHVFDYSQSTQGLWQASGGLFFPGLSGESSPGQLLSREFWSATGSAVSRVSWNLYEYRNGDYVVIGQERAPVHLTYDAFYAYPLEPGYVHPLRANDPNLVAPALLESQGGFTIGSFVATYGFAVQLSGIASPSRALPPSLGNHDTYDAAYIAAGAASDAANQTWIAQIAAILNRSLADAGTITAAHWDNGQIYQSLVITPDAGTALTIGDLFEQPSYVQDNPLDIQFADYSRAFANEDVLFRLTGLDDQFALGGMNGFAARRMTIEAGAGADQINIADGQSAELAGLARRIVVDAGTGDDYVGLTIRGEATVRGGDGADQILISAHQDATAVRVEAEGGDGDDYIQGADYGANLIRGDDGADGLFGGFDSADTIHGGAGDDDIRAGSAFDRFTRENTASGVATLLYGGTGNDGFLAGNGADSIYGGDGNDRIIAFRGNDLIHGGAGRDTYSLSVSRIPDQSLAYGDKTIHDTGGVIEFAAWMPYGLNLGRMARQGNDLILGTLGNSSLRLVDFYLNPAGWSASGGQIDFAAARDLRDPAFRGTPGPDNVTLPGAGHYDALAGNDTVLGSAGADTVEGGQGHDVLRGQGGNDRLEGGDGTDTLDGGSGDDFIFGGTTRADLRDVVYGGDGRDSIDGGAGNDELNGGNGNDTVIGGAGADTLVGNADNDLLAGSEGGDLISGNAGNDTLNGGFGFDRLNGGTGADSFFHQGVSGHGSDFVQDYNAAEGDVLAVGIAGATAGQFQVNFATTVGAGSAGVAEAFVIYRPTGQVLWALVDGADDTVINLSIGGQVFDLV